MSRKHQTLRYHLPGLGTQSVNNCLRLEAIKRQLDPNSTFTDLKFEMLNLVQDSRGFSANALKVNQLKCWKKKGGFTQNKTRWKAKLPGAGVVWGQTKQTKQTNKQNKTRWKTKLGFAGDGVVWGGADQHCSGSPKKGQHRFQSKYVELSSSSM